MKQGWEIKKLGDIAYIGLGFTHTPEYVEKGVAFLSVKDISSGKICWDNIKYVSQQEYDSAPRGAKPSKGDIMFCRVGTMGKPVIIDTDLPFCTFVSLGYLHLLETDIINTYVKYWMQSNSFEIQVEANVKGIAIKNLNTGWLKTFDIPVPPREEQERIVAELDCLSGVIEKKREQLKELDALAQSIFYQMFGDPITNEKGWEVKKWKDMLTIVNGKNQKTVENPVGAYPIYGSGGIMGYADKYLCPKNTIIIGRKGNINKPIFVKEPFWNVDTAFGLIADNIHIAPSFLFFYCRIFNFEQLNKAVTIPSLTKSDLLELNTPCPPLALQQEFADKIEAIEKQKELIKQSITQTEELFNSRMDYYFN